MIECRDISFSYPDGNLALDRVSARFTSGERVALVGQNGAGKSTLSKLLNGLITPSSGEVFLDETSLTRIRSDQIAQRIGYVFQNPNDQIFCTSVRHECAYALERRKTLTTEEIDQRVSDALEVCALTGEAETNPLDLPLAQRKFVTCAAALALRPDYLIIDEPTAGLDDIGRETLSGILQWASQEGICVVAVSHDMRFVIENFPRVVVMSEGTIICDDTASSVFANEAVLERSYLRVPPGVEVARRANASPDLITLDTLRAFFNQLFTTTES